MLVYSTAITPRLQYVLQFMGMACNGPAWAVTTSAEEAKQHSGTIISYSEVPVREGTMHIVPEGLLTETGIAAKTIEVKQGEKFPFFFAGAGTYPFDIFSAIFYLLSRYEEYLPHAKDSYGRFAHEESIAFKEKFLHRPLINEWLQDFKEQLGLQQPIPFTFLPTYDIDIAYSFLHKGVWRNIGAGLLDLITLKWQQLGVRVSVLMGKRKDPFDVFGWLHQLHEQTNIKPYYFFLFAPRRGRYDKNIDPQLPAMQQLVHDHAIRYPVGIHPSWQSGDEPRLIKTEADMLSKATGAEVTASRQHYIRLTLPATYRHLLAAGIRYDFSMGYGSINGFRASVALPFYWYDLEAEKATELMVFPFCYMEANSYFEQKQTAEQGEAEMRKYYETVKQTGGLFVMIWHNSFLCDTGKWKAWRQVYEAFIKETRQGTA